jgi:hypothetical protein
MLKRLQHLTGSVVKEPFARGSKSERDAVLLIAGENRYVLRREGGNAFSDPVLDKLVGKTIRCTGRVAGYTFLISDWTEISPEEAEP